MEFFIYTLIISFGSIYLGKSNLKYVKKECKSKCNVFIQIINYLESETFSNMQINFGILGCICSVIGILFFDTVALIVILILCITFYAFIFICLIKGYNFCRFNKNIKM